MLQAPGMVPAHAEGSLGILAEAALEALPAHLCVIDAAGEIIYVNRAWRQFALDNGGRAEHTCEGTNYLAVCRPLEHETGLLEPHEGAPRELGNFLNALREVIAGQRTHAEAEYPCHSPTEQRWFIVEAWAMAAPGAARAVVVHHPITMRRLADLRQREELRLQSLGTLASGIAHDFNNLLAVILGRSRMALEDLAPGHAAQAHLDALRLAAERARTLVAKILAFSREEPSAAHAQDMVPIVRDTIDLFVASLPAGVQFESSLPERALFSVVDATELTQVVLNLCLNAVDAMQGGAGHIRLALRALADDEREPARRRSPSPNGWAELTVSDNGSGMDEATRQRIFEPFFTTKPRGQGTGLGLSIVYGIVTRSGGTVAVSSQPIKGSSFRIGLPLAADPAAAAAAPAVFTRPTVDSEARGEGQRVLLVDDDEVVGLALEVFLQRAGYQAQRHLDAREALGAVQGGAETFDIAITDQTMPGMSGIELARELAVARPSLPVLLMSGFVDDRLLTLAREAGVRAVLHKERAFDDLMPTLHALRAAPAGEATRGC